MSFSGEQSASMQYPPAFDELLERAQEDSVVRQELGRVVVKAAYQEIMPLEDREEVPRGFEAVAGMYFGLAEMKRGDTVTPLPPMSRQRIARQTELLEQLGIQPDDLALLTQVKKRVMAKYGIKPGQFSLEDNQAMPRQQA